eukprot:SAG11_NODE_9146_length_938_cov_1.455304_1_plen_253_part_10
MSIPGDSMAARLCLLSIVLLLAPATPTPSPPGPPSPSAQLLADGVTYNHGGPGAVNRTLAEVLREHVSVKDFGAAGNCWQTTPSGGDCLDDTAAFVAAFAWATAHGHGHGPVTVHVPSGGYRIDGTLSLGGELVLERGATLRRIANYSGSSEPIVRLSGQHGILRGLGSLSTENPSPRGVVNVGPANLSHYDNVEFNTVADVTIIGSGPSWSTGKAWDDIDESKAWGRGVGMDSSQGWAMTHGGGESTGSCYP